MADEENKKDKPPKESTKQTGKITVDKFLMGKPALSETSRKSFRQRSIGHTDWEALYKEYI